MLKLQRKARDTSIYRFQKEDLGCLLQGKHLEILFPGDELDGRGMIDIGLSDKETKFEINDEVNKFMI